MFGHLPVCRNHSTAGEICHHLRLSEYRREASLSSSLLAARLITDTVTRPCSKRQSITSFKSFAKRTRPVGRNSRCIASVSTNSTSLSVFTSLAVRYRLTANYQFCHILSQAGSRAVYHLHQVTSD